MTDLCNGVILHLGGSGEAAVDVAKSIYYANKKVLNVVVSSENPKHLLGYLPKIDNKMWFCNQCGGKHRFITTMKPGTR